MSAFFASSSGVRSWESNLKWVLFSVYFVENSSLMGLWGWWNVNVPSMKLKQAEEAKKLHWTRETYVISLQFWHYEQLVHIKKAIRLNVIILINAGSKSTLPKACSTCEAITNWRKRECFLPHIKNELRSNMTLRAPNSSPLMAIESDPLIALDFNDVVNAFAQRQ